jgi:hypothetical protein
VRGDGEGDMNFVGTGAWKAKAPLIYWHLTWEEKDTTVRSASVGFYEIHLEPHEPLNVRVLVRVNNWSRRQDMPLISSGELH